MAAVPDSAPCPHCAGVARRIPTAPMVGLGPTAAMRLHDRTRGTADVPDVVDRLPPAVSPRPQMITNPLHHKLPRR
ncbi:hypothetical protein AWC27_05985 [Mycobacterium szulgai]|uniref:Uncharacterized protein n=2 Tax=Mycobacterium szulgai TaxID=1787 RepID=A0A1X2E6Q5_MYCSZ|nr:hypothetical protein AWC27_05985 [Mycobacterium szulgai]